MTKGCTIVLQFMTKFKPRNMEDRMHLHLRREESVSHNIYLLHNEIWTKISRTEFVIWKNRQGRLSIRLKFNINPITNLEMPISPMSIGMCIHPLLGLMQMKLSQLKFKLSA